MLNRRVDLPSGGYLMIDYAEALTVIDVNTGSFTGKGKSARLEDTITKTNLEAAEEVVNQLRLRDIGGIIVIDFIDMARARNRDAVLKVLRKALDEDRTKTFVVEISPLGLVEMTRQNVTDGVREIMSKTCPVCHGEGVVKSEETIAIGIARHLRHMVDEAGDDAPEAYLLRINPRVSAWFTADGARELHALEEQTGKFFHFEGSEGLPLDHFAVTMEGPRDEIEAARRAVPGRRGGPRRHRRAAHVQPGRRRREGRRLPDLRRPTASRSWARRSSCGSSRRAAPPPSPRSPAPTPRRPRRPPRSARRSASESDERASRSAAAKRGAASRKAREEADKPAKPAKAAKRRQARPKPRRRKAATGLARSRRRTSRSRAGRRRRRPQAGRGRRGVEADAVKALSDQESAEAGTAPAAVEDAENGSENGDDALSSRPRRRGRRGGRRRSRAKASADADASE